MNEIPEAMGVVYVVDDDDAVRDSVQWLLEASRYRVIGFTSAEEFLSKHDPAAIAVAIFDVRMPGMSGLELQEQLISRKSRLPIIFITGHGDVPMAVSTMKKVRSTLSKAFRSAALKALVERMLVDARAHASATERQRLSEALLSKLTPREQQVLERIVAGRLNKQIADDLGISIKTVEAHRANIMDKMNANTVADLMRTVLTGGALR